MALSEEAQELARQWAKRDRDLLTRLVKAGKVIRGDIPAGLQREAAALKRDIDQRLRPAINLAIRPKRRRKR